MLPTFPVTLGKGLLSSEFFSRPRGQMGNALSPSSPRSGFAWRSKERGPCLLLNHKRGISGRPGSRASRLQWANRGGRALSGYHLIRHNWMTRGETSAIPVFPKRHVNSETSHIYPLPSKSNYRFSRCELCAYCEILTSSSQTPEVWSSLGSRGAPAPRCGALLCSWTLPPATPREPGVGARSDAEPAGGAVRLRRRLPSPSHPLRIPH